MKTLRRLEPAESPPETLADDPSFAAEAATLAKLEAASARVLRELDWHQMRAAGSGGLSSTSPRRQAVERRIAVLGEEFSRQHDDGDVLAIALALADGDEGLASPPDREGRVAVLHGHDRLLRNAIAAQADIVDRIRSDLSVDHAERLRPAHDDLLIAIYRAAQALSCAMDAERQFRADAILSRGYSWCPSIVPAPDLSGALLLGSETDFNSEIARWRRFLEARGVL
jgi:hypothetical protein